MVTVTKNVSMQRAGFKKAELGFDLPSSNSKSFDLSSSNSFRS